MRWCFKVNCADVRWQAIFRLTLHGNAGESRNWDAYHTYVLHTYLIWLLFLKVYFTLKCNVLVLFYKLIVFYSYSHGDCVHLFFTWEMCSIFTWRLFSALFKEIVFNYFVHGIVFHLYIEIFSMFYTPICVPFLVHLSIEVTTCPSVW